MAPSRSCITSHTLTFSGAKMSRCLNASGMIVQVLLLTEVKRRTVQQEAPKCAFRKHHIAHCPLHLSL